MAKHKHHIVPKYEGGSDDPSNLVDLSVTQHAMWHFAEWQRKGRKEDKIAWQGLAKIIGKEEAIKQAAGLGGAKSKGRTISEETRQKISKSCLGKNRGKRKPRPQEVRDRIAETKRGKKWYVNQKGETSTFSSHPGEGWVLGMRLRTG